MSRESKLEPGSSPDASDQQSDEELFLQIDVRLRLDEVAAAEAARLLGKPPQTPSRKELSRLACQMFDARRTRDRMMNRDLFGEPAWDMLLALYCLPSRGERLSVTGLNLAAEVPSSTGLRWQAILTEQGLIERGPKELDKRVQLVRLTDRGRELLESYLTKLYHLDRPTRRSFSTTD